MSKLTKLFYYHRVDHDQEIGKKFHIRMNRRKSKKKIDHVISKGNCCWEISDRHGNKETLGVGVGRDTKNVKYISTVRTIECSSI